MVVVIWRNGVAYDETGRCRDDVRQDTCFSCGKSFLVSDAEGFETAKAVAGLFRTL